MAQDYSAMIAAMQAGPEVQAIRKRATRRAGEAGARAQSEIGRRGLISSTGTSDIEFAARRGARAPIEEAAALAEAGVVGRGVEAERGRQFQTSERLGRQAFGTSEREAGQFYGTGEREAGQRYGTSERLGGQQFATGERVGGQEWTGGQRETQRQWQTGESALDREAQVKAASEAWNRQQAASKRDFWKRFF